MKKDLIDSLEELRSTLVHSGSVERAAGLKKAMGPNCEYYKKAKRLFMERDYERVRSLLVECIRQIQELEPPPELPVPGNGVVRE